MAREGRIQGRVNGNKYELVQNGTVRLSVPLAQLDDKMKATIRRNSWEQPHAG